MPLGIHRVAPTEEGEGVDYTGLSACETEYEIPDLNPRNPRIKQNSIRVFCQGIPWEMPK